MSIVLSVGIESYVAKDLHSNDGVNEEQHPDQEDNVGQSLSHEQRYQCKIEREGLLNATDSFSKGFTHFKRLHKCPEQNPDRVGLPEMLNYPDYSEQT